MPQQPSGAAALLLFVSAITGCYATCVATGVNVEVEAGRFRATVQAPELAEGGSARSPCSEVVPGYLGSVELRCFGGAVTAYAGRCRAAGCAAGLSTMARLHGNLTAAASLTDDLDDGEAEHVPCGRLADGYDGHVRLECQRGTLMVDASGCRPIFSSSQSAWRVLNEDYLPGTWRVFELSLYTEADCLGGRLDGQPVASSEDLLSEEFKAYAFDGDISTSWAAGCPRGCDPLTAWLGLSLESPSARVRCARILQSQVACCSTPRIRLEAWDGSRWQEMIVWETEGMTRRYHGFELVVPITCTREMPDGLAVIHDCEGPKVRGYQAGEVCIASCEDGWYGEKTTYECLPDGSFTGDTPVCYELASVARTAQLIIGLSSSVFFACQYRFWCMQKKVRLIEQDHEQMIPLAMRGRWPKHGDIWEEMLRVQKAEAQTIGNSEAVDKQGTKAQAHDALAKADNTFGDFVKDLKPGDKKKKGQEPEPDAPSMDGLCSPCEDPDVCWSCLFCPHCRIADTWHTIGVPAWLTYWRVMLLYLICPILWPCLNFYGRLKEARLVDAPTHLFLARRRALEIADRNL